MSTDECIYAKVDLKQYALTLLDFLNCKTFQYVIM